jgi:hypothetical protein
MSVDDWKLEWRRRPKGDIGKLDREKNEIGFLHEILIPVPQLRHKFGEF